MPLTSLQGRIHGVSEQVFRAHRWVTALAPLAGTCLRPPTPVREP